MDLTRWAAPVVALFSLTAGCKHHPNAGVVQDKSVARTAAHTLGAPETSVTGTWCGMFEPTEAAKMFDNTTGDSIPVVANKITLFIDQIQDGEISGYSVCAGRDRPFKGVYTEDRNTITATLTEPDDNQYNGTFNLVISKSPLSLTGKFSAFNPAQAGRHYTLTRRNFAYSLAGRYPEGSERLLTSDDVNNLYKDDLRRMRNEIYERHGYSFKLREVREWFDGEDWYMPISTDVRNKLSAIEKKNEQLIKHFEKYADTYDDFGR
jgi:hypothetical protein